MLRFVKYCRNVLYCFERGFDWRRVDFGSKFRDIWRRDSWMEERRVERECFFRLGSERQVEYKGDYLGRFVHMLCSLDCCNSKNYLN